MRGCVRDFPFVCSLLSCNPRPPPAEIIPIPTHVYIYIYRHTRVHTHIQWTINKSTCGRDCRALDHHESIEGALFPLDCFSNPSLLPVSYILYKACETAVKCLENLRRRFGRILFWKYICIYRFYFFSKRARARAQTGKSLFIHRINPARCTCPFIPVMSRSFMGFS